MPSQDAWGLALQFLPAYLTDSSAEPGTEWYSMYRDLRGWRPNRRRQEGRDLLALVLAQKPHSPEAYHAHSEAKLLLLRRALSCSQHLGRQLLRLRRRTEIEGRVHVSAHDFTADMQRPRRPKPPMFRFNYPDVFWVVPALGETEEEAGGQVDLALEWLAQGRSYGLFRSLLGRTSLG